MSERSVVVRLEAEVSKFVRGQEQAKKATDETTKAQEALGKAVDEAASKSEKGSERVAKGNRKQAQSSEDAAKSSKKSEDASKSDAKAKEQQADAAEKAGKGLLIFGTTSVAALGASAKAAMDWESAWAGVTKTVDGSPAQMQELEGGLRQLAKTLPSTHTEIAAVAEAAGQLGVKREDILKFTKTMVDLGETTNLTAEEAATSIAQIANVFGTRGEDIDNFGATLVALGNDGASTEKEILSMAQRIAGAGKTVGATEGEVLALSNTLASMGVQAELGGGVSTRALLKMYGAVQDGGPKLEAFAKAAGTSAEDFSKAFRDSPVKALDLVTKGMARTNAEGGNVVAMLRDMGMKGTEEMQVMLALAGAGDLLSDSLSLQSKAWVENTALANEAAKRYETTESKVKVAWNNIKDAAIDAGAATLPVIQGLAEGVSGLAQGFGSLPAPVQGAVTVLAGVTGGAALLAGGLLTVIPKIRDTAEAFKVLDTKSDGSSRGLGKAAKVAGAAAAAYAALATAAALAAAATDGSRSKTSVEDFNNALSGVATRGDAAKKSLDGAFNGVTKPGNSTFTAVNDLDSAMKRIFNPQFNDNMNDFWSTVTGQNATSGINVTKAALGDMDKSLASMAQSGNLEDAAAGFKLAADAAEAQGKPVSALVELFPEYKAAILATKTANGETQVSQEALTEAMLKGDPAAVGASKAQEVLKGSLDETGVGLDAVIEDMDKFLEQLFASGMITMSARDANAAYNDALRGIPETLKTIAESQGKLGRTLNDTATDFDLTTEAGAAANSALQDVARKGMAEVEAKAAEGLGQDELQAKLTTTYDDLVKSADQMGIHGQAAVDLARDILGIPPGVSIESWMSDKAKATADETKKSMDAIDGRVVKTYTEHQEKTIRSIETQISQSEYRDDPSMVGFRPGTFAPARAGGGDLDIAPGPKGQDSQLFWGAKGEHVFTDREVDLMGGQQAVYQFRADLRAGNIPRHQKGGAMGSVGSVAAPSSFGGGSSVSVSLELNVNGTTAPREVADEAMGMIRGELMKQGVKLGG
ncbi:phage tail tape measure protein [Paenarthrobacter nitroguajacolicus]|uniref:Phage tail tape measure protein n=1 Tax=Paenarthrobacter nitroguajacolicus TaxID=211146 RepID=A0A558GXF9_PAENT|nr:phage tail tape measure protein [Paenarthrobacter nitroguajacolicus]TVU61570.1 phage tail tape measure protein [Paenarthrobacter nitroguajacolicus]